MEDLLLEQYEALKLEYDELKAENEELISRNSELEEFVNNIKLKLRLL